MFDQNQAPPSDLNSIFMERLSCCLLCLKITYASGWVSFTILFTFLWNSSYVRKPLFVESTSTFNHEFTF